MANKRRLERGIAGLLVVVMLLTMVPLAGVPPVMAQGTTVFVNELHYDNDSTDAGEFIEVAGRAGTDLAGWSLVLYNGNGGAVYNTRDLSGVVIPDQENGFGTAVFYYAVNGIQNGSPDGLALVEPGGAVMQFLSYEGAFVAVDGPAAGMTSTDIGVQEPGTDPIGESLQLVGTGSAYEDFTWNLTPVPNTGGTPNTGQTFAEVPDSDDDGIPDDVDNCPYDSNSGQEDGDGDGIGDVCDGCPADPDNDIDGDGICGDVDNCPNVPNSGQEDADGDGLGDACDSCPNDPENDIDADGICGDVDNCPYVYNPGQEDSDGDGIGDACDAPDADGDGIPDDVDNCPSTANPGQEDGDGDGIGDVCDGCPNDPENDADADGICGDVDNCPNASNPGQEDGDGDGIGDACDSCPADPDNDVDGDGVCGDVDNCPYVPNPGQEDNDGDGVGDACDVPDVSIIINEVDSDTPSYDALEFIELYDGGAGNTALDGLVVVLFNGSDDASYDPAFDLDGFSTDADGYFVIGTVSGADIHVEPGTYGWLQNGADAVALYSGDGASFPNDTPVTTDGLLDALVYDTSDSDDAGLLVLLNAGQAQINEGGLGDKDNQSNQRCPNGEGGARNTDTYTQFVATPGAANCELPPPPIVINEVDSDTPSYDALEFIELYDGGAGNTALDGLALVLFNGSDDASYDPAFDLDGFTTDADGYFVIGTVAGADIYVEPGTYGWLQNGADAVALYVGDGADFPNDTPVTTDNLLDAFVYDTNDGDDAGLLALLNAGQPQINEDGLGDKDNQSNQRCPNGEGGARYTDTYTQFVATPGAANCELPPEVCGDPFTPIYTIQGSGLASPLDGTEVSTEGIVVGDFQDGKSGYYIQDALGDGDPATSDGIFVYGASPDVNVGDHVRVHGYVDEYYDLTEITGVSQVLSCSTGDSVAPTALSLPVTSVDDFEAYEGMLVTFPQALYISEYYGFGRYGEIVLTTERQFQPTATYEPGSPEAAALAEANGLSRITVDDGRSSQNPDPAIHPNGNIFDMTNLFRGGDTVQYVTGVVDYNYGAYKVQPTQGADYTPANPRTGPDGVGGNLKVASFNVLNYFTTIDTGTWICGPSGDMECRGADTDEEFARQRAKIIAALAAIDADVVGLIEIENNEYEAVADLVSGLNDAMGATAYAYVNTGYIGTDAIKVAFIYKPATVSPVGDYAILDSSVDSRFIDTKNRPVLAQTFMDNATGGIFTVAVNHLKSKGSPCDDLGDPDLGDGAGSCNLTRTAAAEAMVDWLATDPTGSSDSDFLIIGDLNSYDKEDPIDVLVAGGYTDLALSLVGEYAYSYVFDGQLGYLDYALASAGLLGEISGATVWQINADEPNLIDYDMSYKQDAQDALYAPDAYRASDHDPVIAGLNVCDEIAPTAEIRLNRDYLWPPNHRYVTVRAHVDADDNFDPDPTVTLVSVTSNEPDNGLGDGDKADDIVIMNDFTFKLRAERSGGGQDRIYTITYQVTDFCGNVTYATATVTVLHDRRKIR